MNHRKDYLKAVRIVQELSDEPTIRRCLADAFVRFFRDDNPRFDAERFVAAAVSLRAPA